MAVHRKAVALMDPIEAVARLAARAGERAESAQTRASGSASFDNADGTRTVIGPQTGSATMATHVGDVTPPPVPTGVRAWSGDGSLHVLWAGSLDGATPADFDHVTILVDGEPVAEMRSAGSVTVDGLAVGQTVSVTATAEDDACLADGTPAHNVSAPSAAVKVTIRDAVAEVRADADAHGEQIEAVKQDIAAYKASAEATYATKTEVDERTGAITRTLAADYTKTVDLASTDAVKDAKGAGTAAQTQLAGYKATNDKAVAAAKKAGTDAQGQLADYMESNDAAVADAKAAGTGASAALDSYKGVVSETYAEKTELTEAVNQLSSTMTSNYSAFTDYRKTNDTAVSKAQTDATNAQSTIDSYKTANDRAVADAKAAGTTAQDQLGAYKSSNDAAVAAAKKAGTDAQSQLGAYKTATDQRLTELQNVADNAIESWYLKGAPSTSNAPAKDWTTDALKRQHAGDLYMDTDTGYSYRWSGTEWVQVKDSDVTKALKEIESVKTDYATKSELSATDTELSGKVSDALTTAKSYTDSSVEQEVTARNAAIKAQADSISLDVSRTYTRSDTFSAYQTDADNRIATANSNASTAVSTAQTAASDAATAKTMATENKSSIRQLSDSITSEVTERGKLAGRVGTLESTSGTHTSKLEQLASSIKSLVKGESTYTDPDGKSATSGIYSLVTQTRDSVTALFGQYTKTADLASTQAVKDAKKAGTDAASAASAAQSTADTAKANAATAQSTANAAKSTADGAKSTASAASSTASSAKSTADSLATLIRADSTGITVGKSADGKTWSTGRTRMTADSFDVLDKAGNVLSSFGKSLIELGKNSKDATISMLAGLARIKATSAGVSDGAWCVMSTDEFISVEGYHASRLAAGYKDDSGFNPQGVAEVMVQGGEGGGVMMYAGAHGSDGNSLSLYPGGFTMNHPEYMLSALGLGMQRLYYDYDAGWVVYASDYLVWIYAWGVAIGSGSWDSKTCPYVLPKKYRPRLSHITTPTSVNNGGSWTSVISVNSQGQISVKNKGNAGSTDARYGVLLYPVGV